MTCLCRHRNRSPSTTRIIVWIFIHLCLFLRHRYKISYLLKTNRIFCIHQDVFMHITDGFTILTRISFLPYNLCDKIMAPKQFITQDPNICLFCVINTYPNATFCFMQQVPQDGKPWTNKVKPNAVFKVIIVMLKCRTGIIRRIYVPADFDTIENAFSGAKPPKKAYNKGLSRSVFDFESPFCLYSIGV